MKRVITSALGLMMFAFMAMPSNAAEYAQVASLQPFTAEANYMSLPGYLRYVTFETTGVWLSREEAVAIVNNQIEAASR